MAIPDHTITALSMTAVLVSTVHAQAPFQHTVDTASGYWSSVILENGDMVMSFPGSAAHHFLACDAEGEPLYRTSIPAPAGYRSISLAARPGGGFFAVSQVSDSLFGIPWSPDSLVGIFELNGFTASGAVDLRRRFTTSFITDSYDNQVENLACDGSGLYITVNRGNQATHELRVLRVSLAGDLLWARSYVIEGSGLASYDQHYKIAMTGDGGMYFARNVDFDVQADVVIGRIDGTGALVWLKAISYEVDPAGFSLGELEVLSDGTAVLVGALVGGGVFAITPDGSSMHGHLYTLPAGLQPYLCTAGAAADGGLLTVSRLMGSINGLTRAVILRLDADLELATARGTEIVASGQTASSLRACSIAEVGDHAVILGNRFIQDTVFLSSSWRPTLWKVDLAATDACMLSEPQVTHYPVPQDLLNFSDRDMLPTSDVAVNWSTLDPAWSPGAPFTTSDLCALLVSTPESDAPPSTMHVFPNPSSRGSMVRSTCAGATRFSVYSSTGAVILDIAASPATTCSIDASSLAAGLYHVVAFDTHDQRIAVTKWEVR